MQILITGARAPVAVEWARILLRQGHTVFMSDCLRSPLGRFVSGIQNYIQTPSPRLCFSDYQTAILKLIDTHRIEWVIPTCEEVFYLARLKSQRPEINWLFPDASLLYPLHNKLQIFELLQGLPGVSLPHTRLIDNHQNIDLHSDTILKPLYSRFGTHVIRNVTSESIGSLPISEQHLWIQQQKLHGRSFCNYALFHHGKLVAHQIYLPGYCVNGSAASYFFPVEDERILRFTQAFGERHRYHGQVSFDFMEDGDALYVIECNPRATSGLHLLASQLTSLTATFTPPINRITQPHHLGPVMLIAAGLSSLLKIKSWKDYFQGKSILQDKRYPLPFYAPWLSLYEQLKQARKLGQTLSAASTHDIEWNGEKCPDADQQ